MKRAAAFLLLATTLSAADAPDYSTQPANTWVKRTPGAGTPVSPRLGYEGAIAWDPLRGLLVRYGGHNQGGGGEQGSEVWTLDPRTLAWRLHETNLSPPGLCCGAQNVFDPAGGRYLRFPSFSGSHGWQWWREIYLNDSTVWSFDPATATWRNMRPLPAPHVAPLRCASWDTDTQTALVFGGETGPRETLAYDPHRNEWRWLKPPQQPEARSGGQMAYDAARRVHVMFGSQFNDDTHTWLYDAAKNEWRDAKPAVSPPSAKNDAVLAYDASAKRVLALVKITEGKDDDARHRIETWSYDGDANTWEKMNPATEPDPAGNRARQLVFAPELGVTILENCAGKPREQQVWTYRFATSKAAPATPRPAPLKGKSPGLVEDAVVSVISATRVELTWPRSEDAHGWHVERADVEVWSDDQLKRLKRATTPLAEPSVGALRRIGAFRRITEKPLTDPSLADTSVNLAVPHAIEGEPVFEKNLHLEHLDPAGRAYRLGVCAYRIRAVDAAGAEGGASPLFFTIPSAPQHVLGREDGPACRLKWRANPERALHGYRVYRMDGRYEKDPIPRLTPEPLDALTFTDPAAGKSARRYYIVAVDALGQEGFPSSPVWFEREWKQYYAPFVGEWHQ